MHLLSTYSRMTKKGCNFVELHYRMNFQKLKTLTGFQRNPMAVETILVGWTLSVVAHIKIGRFTANWTRNPIKLFASL